MDLNSRGHDRNWSNLEIPDKGWEVVGRRQAVLRKVGEDYRIYDGDRHKPSSNRVFLNHTRISRDEGYLLKHGITLEIGQDSRNQVLLTYINKLLKLLSQVLSMMQLGKILVSTGVCCVYMQGFT